jgi:hypothetical protein
MGANEWRDAPDWPPQPTAITAFHLAGTDGDRRGRLQLEPPTAAASRSEIVADPRNPVLDPYVEFGPHDYAALANRSDVLTFDTVPLDQDWLVTGAVTAVIQASCDCRDFDLWVRLQDVYPDGRAINLMSPGNDVLRASYRLGDERRELLTPGSVYELRLPMLLTSNLFAKGHRIRAQISASFAPHLSRNLQTGESEVTSAESRPARISIHHDGSHPSTLQLPIVRRDPLSSPGTKPVISIGSGTTGSSKPSSRSVTPSSGSVRPSRAIGIVTVASRVPRANSMPKKRPKLGQWHRRMRRLDSMQLEKRPWHVVAVELAERSVGRQQRERPERVTGHRLGKTKGPRELRAFGGRHLAGIDRQSWNGVVLFDYDRAVVVTGDGVTACEQRYLRELQIRVVDVVGTVADGYRSRCRTRLEHERKAGPRVRETRVVRQLHPECRASRHHALDRDRHVDR